MYLGKRSIDVVQWRSSQKYISGGVTRHREKNNKKERLYRYFSLFSAASHGKQILLMQVLAEQLLQSQVEICTAPGRGSPAATAHAPSRFRAFCACTATVRWRLNVRSPADCTTVRSIELNALSKTGCRGTVSSLRDPMSANWAGRYR